MLDRLVVCVLTDQFVITFTVILSYRQFKLAAAAILTFNMQSAASPVPYERANAAAESCSAGIPISIVSYEAPPRWRISTSLAQTPSRDVLVKLADWR